MKQKPKHPITKSVYEKLKREAHLLPDLPDVNHLKSIKQLYRAAGDEAVSEYVRGVWFRNSENITLKKSKISGVWSGVIKFLKSFGTLYHRNTKVS